MPFKVFISYSTDDFPIVERVRRLLQSEDIEVFVAEYSVEPGERLTSKIEKGIRDSDLFVLLWSRHSKESEWVPQEIGIAKSQGKPIIPVVLESGIEPPGFIGDLKYLKAGADPGESLAWLRKNVLERAAKKQREQAVAVFGIGALVVWLLNRA